MKGRELCKDSNFEWRKTYAWVHYNAKIQKSQHFKEIRKVENCIGGGLVNETSLSAYY